MKLEPLCGKAHQATGHKHSIIALEGSIRSGKTYASLIDWLAGCVRQGPRGDLVMCGKTERTIITNLLYPLQEWLGDRRVVISRGLGLAWVLGRRVMLIGGNNEAAETKLRGATYAGGYLDEASTVPESFFNMLYSRLSVPGAQLWLTSNPETPAHWLKTGWLDRARLWIDREGHRLEDPEGIDLVRITFKLEDNPNLDPDYVRRIKAAYTGLWYRRLILGDWCIAAGAVYTDWDPARHVLRVKDLPPIRRVIAVGIDYGTTHPTRGYLLGLSEEKRPRLVVLSEWGPERATDSGLSKALRQWLGRQRPEWQRPEWVCVDPSAASFKLQLYEDGLSGLTDADNSVLDGIRTVASLFATDLLVVSETCKDLIAKLPAYSWDPKATARGDDEPLKEQDDEADALRYAVASTRPIWGPQVPITFPSA